MFRLVLQLVLALAVLSSPLLCCCSLPAAAPSPAAPSPATPAEKCCCCKHQDRADSPDDRPSHPQPGDCSCKQKQPRAIGSPSDAARDFKLVQPGDWFVVADAPPAADPVHLADHLRLTALPVTWFANAQDLLRALQTLRL